MKTTQKRDIYQMITDKFIAELEKGLIPWHKPWTGVQDGAISYESGRPYSLLNQMLLGKAGEWLTFLQIQKAGGRIQRGQQASFVVFWTQYTYEEELEDGSKLQHTLPVLRYYNVWHIDQTEGISKRWDNTEQPREVLPIETAEELVQGYFGTERVTLHNTEPTDKACYSPRLDRITIPMLQQFDNAEEYYSTLFHEMVHSTGHATRLNRKEVAEHAGVFGDSDYSKEELVAELGSAFLCNNAHLDTDKTFRNSAAYLQSWLRTFKNDRKMIVFAASKAEAAAKYIINKTSQQ